jgi:hypothetical protein
VAPQAPAGYSGTPLPKKLGIKVGSVVALVGAPEGFAKDTLGPLAPGALWIAWPKKASGVVTDLDGNIVRDFGLAAGLVDYKIAAIDATWSGLCFARRKGR